MNLTLLGQLVAFVYIPLCVLLPAVVGYWLARSKFRRPGLLAASCLLLGLVFPLNIVLLLLAWFKAPDPTFSAR
ncbi:hypothetical protein SAMN05216271_3061 [Halopseudomonas sabulinigri]|uniref:Uncharacterized protein n=1 Tax=Halopseudomonas sabulinigri TaxID=472181 RepID=A0A1H1W0R8_9GAMM|nr:hypothetical protein SAMN05216271_3061 [Halopseudomonas sabulinigri]